MDMFLIIDTLFNDYVFVNLLLSLFLNIYLLSIVINFSLKCIQFAPVIVDTLGRIT